MDLNSRNYGVDLFRIVLTYMVCLLHTLGRGGLLNSCVQKTINYNVLWFLEIMAYCAVDGYGLISGFTAKENKTLNVQKIILMWLQVFFYSFILTLLFYIIGFDNQIDIKTFFKSLIPVSTCTYWYFSAYFPLVIFEPIIVKTLNLLNNEQLIRLFILILGFFSFSGSISDAYKIEKGYSFIWLLELFVLGYILKRLNLFSNWKKEKLLFYSFAMNIITFISFIFVKTDKLINYVSPTILFCAMFQLIYFSKLKPKVNLIKLLSPLTFGIYLFQNNLVVWKKMENAFVFILKYKTLIVLIYVFVIAFLIFFIGSIVEKLRICLFKFLNIDSLSIRIEKNILRILKYFEKTINCLK